MCHLQMCKTIQLEDLEFCQVLTADVFILSSNYSDVTKWLENVICVADCCAGKFPFD